jgi:hypothetical protein
MNSDNVFLTKWKPKHDEGFLRYAMHYILPVAIVTIFSAVFFSYKNQALGVQLYELLRYNLFAILLYSLLTIYNWYSSEKRYKRITNDRN